MPEKGGPMNFRLLYYLQTNIVCVMVLFVVLLLLVGHSRKQSRERAFLTRLIGISICYCIADTMSWLTDGKADSCAIVLATIANIVYIGLPLFVYGLWINYVYYKTSKENYKPGRIEILNNIPIWILALLVASSPITGFAFRIDEQGVYHRGVGAYVVPIVCLLYVVYAAILLIRSYRSKENRMNRDVLRPMIFFPVPIVIAAILQILFFGLSLNQVGITASILLFYMDYLFSKISMDDLTGLNNRRELKQFLNNNFESPGTDSIFLCMIDLDHFKEINDTLGHQEGNEALRAFSAILKRSCNRQKKRYFLARYGGDEFILAGINTAEDRIQEMIKIIYEVTDEYNTSSGKPYKLEFSIGYSCGTPELIGTMDDLLNRADEKMYANKVARKANRIS